MGIAGVSGGSLLLILLLAVLLFGSNKLKTLGKDLGGAIREFKKALEDNKDIK